MADIKWNPIATVPKDGSDVLLFFPLKGLHHIHPRVVICYWCDALGSWVYQGRASRGYSDGYQPTHWAALSVPGEDLVVTSEGGVDYDQLGQPV